MKFKYLGIDRTSYRNIKEVRQVVRASKAAGSLSDIVRKKKHPKQETKAIIYKTRILQNNNKHF